LKWPSPPDPPERKEMRYVKKKITLFRLLWPIRRDRFLRNLARFLFELTPEWEYQFAMDDLDASWEELRLRMGVELTDSFEDLKR
jgi:hypothetical protein